MYFFIICPVLIHFPHRSLSAAAATTIGLQIQLLLYLPQLMDSGNLRVILRGGGCWRRLRGLRRGFEVEDGFLIWALLKGGGCQLVALGGVIAALCLKYYVAASRTGML